MVILKEDNTEEVQEGVWKEAKLHGPGSIQYDHTSSLESR